MAKARKAEDPDKSKGFWQTLPGILTGVAALITAVTGLIVGVLHTTPPNPNDNTTKHDHVATPSPQPSPSASPNNHASGGSLVRQSGEGTNLLASDNGGRLVSATSPDWRQTTVGSQGYGVVGGHDPEEAVYSFRDGAAATFTSFKMLVSQVNPSNVKRFELLASDDSPTSGFRSIGKFEVQNSIAPDDPYQEFKFAPTKARYFKVRLLQNQNGYKNPFEIREFQLIGELDTAN
ncbi:MAG TPA: hypothetical protein VKE93_19965 [Candidatus Angelobacter sp.]|nr:hypothetical protein [Candidatus Angelobacter sp.]